MVLRFSLKNICDITHYVLFLPKIKREKPLKFRNDEKDYIYSIGCSNATGHRLHDRPVRQYGYGLWHGQ
jgi:hypothetical protein